MLRRAMYVDGESLFLCGNELASDIDYIVIKQARSLKPLSLLARAERGQSESLSSAGRRTVGNKRSKSRAELPAAEKLQ
jgi:hypothetical protein